ncbi:ribosomal protection-like ABC-F family protein [Marinilactibacillus piezotolerans]|uniref:ribosomal protection-like ABC-F family protein n=1 Tax=Marinilactibacillus piezotolerans TaxID=258723 RepID=UPI0009B1261B|nr:ABC-F family ATP-binding cassette domain-containing protein [Marinilactibacillus piezotolerans]
MAWLELNQIKHSVRDRTLFEIEHLTIEPGDRIGLVGTNGSGKTTLLNIIKGTIQPDTGTVIRQKSVSLLPQLRAAIGIKSGGEVTANTIISVLNEKAGILLADEPTTHLDVEHVEWLEKEISQYQGAYIIVSHDRDFLDKTCQQIWELDQEEIKVYSGNYSAFEEEKKRARKQQQISYEAYKKKERQLLQAAESKKSKADSITAESSHFYFRKKAQKLYKSAKSMESRMEQLEKVEKPSEPETIKMTLTNSGEFINKYIIRATDFSVQFPKKVLWKPSSFFIKGGEKVAIVGPNGSGKTTLLQHLINGSERIQKTPAVKIGYFAQDLSVLDQNKTILENVAEGSVQTETLIRIVLAQLLFKQADVHKSVRVLSGGERVKVALAKLILGDYNTLVLDEPTNFLDTQAIEALESLLSAYEGSVILVTHDRRIMNQFADKLLILENQQIETFAGTYAEYQLSGSNEEITTIEEELMRIENEIVAVLGKLSTAPSQDLEEQFEQLIAKKRVLNKKDQNK